MEALREIHNRTEHDQILEKIKELYKDLFCHQGYGSIEISMRFLKKDQKEIVINYGKDFRYVVHFDENDIEF